MGGQEMRWIILLFLISCTQMAKKSPRLAWNEKFYWMRIAEPGVIYERNCKNGIGDRRKCDEIEKNLIEEWSNFSPSFIVIPYNLVYP